MESLKDVRFALRLLWKSPWFTLAALVPLALGIGVNTAMFSVADGIMRKPLSFPDLDRIAMVFQVAPDRNSDLTSLTPADYADLQRSSHSFEQLAAFEEQRLTMTGVDVPRRVTAAAVLPNFFAVLRTPALKGRLLAESAGYDATREIVVSYQFWQTQLASDPGVVGRRLELERKAYTVAGVLPRSFGFPLGTDIWIPLQMDPAAWYDRSSHSLGVVAKLRPGVSTAQSNAELTILAASVAAAHPDSNRGWKLRLVPLTEFLAGGMTSQYIFFLIGGVVFVLAMACFNVANLLLARGTARRKELAIRQAMGASRWRMVGLLLTESTIVAVLGLLFALPLAMVALQLIRAGMPPDMVRYIPGFDAIGLDPTALAFAFGIAVSSGLIAGVMPALQVTRLAINEILKEGGRSGDDGHGTRHLRRLLLSAEIAFAMTLLVGTAFMVKGVRTLGDIIPGSEPEKLLTFRLDLPPSRYPDLLSCQRFLARVEDALQGLPQVEGNAIGSNIPYGGQGSTMRITPEGAAPALPGDRRAARSESVSPSYLQTLHIGLRAGRNFSASDGRDTAPVALVSASLAKRYWPNGDPIGRRLKLDDSPDPRWITVVGVVDNVRYNWLDQADTPALYLPYAQMPRRAVFVLVRALDPMRVAREAQARVLQLDPGLPIEALESWDRVIAESMIGLSYVASIMTVLGLVALALASFGLYGLMSYDVRMKRTEIGIRMALGASRAAILRFVVGRATLVSAIGVALGIPCAVSISYLMRKLIVGVAPLDWSVYVLPAMVLLAVGALAAYAPVRSAFRTSPTEILRS
jgi:putative ABC transport system permease protein